MRIRPFGTLFARILVRHEIRRGIRARSLVTLTSGQPERELSVSSAHAMRTVLTSQIHPFAGVGHQLSSWISGYLWADDLGLPYAGGSITKDDTNIFSFKNLASIPNKSKKIRLSPVPNELNPTSLSILRHEVNAAITRWPNRSLHFVLPLDQPRWDQSPASAAVRESVLSGSLGTSVRHSEMETPRYIAVHIRRGDIQKTSNGGNSAVSRWLDESWYVGLINSLRESPLLQNMPIRVYSLGSAADFPLLSREDVDLRIGGSRDDDFAEMCGAALLVCAPSSFSFSAGLASKGVVLAKSPWWHAVPDEARWVALTDDGLDQSDLERALKYVHDADLGNA
jgi:hypothetical protein